MDYLTNATPAPIKPLLHDLRLIRDHGSSWGITMRVPKRKLEEEDMRRSCLENLRPGTLYLSTGSGWSPATNLPIAALAARPDALLVAATDNDRQGAMFADRLAAIALSAAPVLSG